MKKDEEEPKKEIGGSEAKKDGAEIQVLAPEKFTGDVKMGPGGRFYHTDKSGFITVQVK